LTGSIRRVGEDGAEGLLVANGRGVTFEDAEGSIAGQVSAWLDVAEGDEPADHAVAVRALVCAGEAAPALQARVVDVLLWHLAGAHRNLVLETLGELAPVSVAAVPALVALLAHENAQTRYWATFALGRMGRLAAVAVPGLERLVDDPEYGPRYGALDALMRIAADSTKVAG
jgi:HEAT repeat protein